MKKRIVLNKYKKNNYHHAINSARAKKIFKIYKRNKNRSEQGLPKDEKTDKRKLEGKYKSHTKVVAPSNFSLIENPAEIADFINNLKGLFTSRRKVFVILKHVEKINYDAIIVLLSVMVRFKSHNIGFNGDFPLNLNAKRTLIESGFFENLYKNFKNEDRYKLGFQKVIHTHAWKNVDSKLSAQVIENASKKIWNEPRRCQGVQRTMLELMLNTNNHASLVKGGDKHWWLSTNYIAEHNKVAFSFVDYGVGVFNSLNNKTKKSKFHGWTSKMTDKFKYGSNADLLKLIMEGELHRTVTGKHWRGKGLPGIFEAFKRNQISNLYIITNDVFADVSSNNFKTIKTNFPGTFIYWEINQRSLNTNGSIGN